MRGVRHIVAGIAVLLIVAMLAAALAWWWRRWSATRLPHVPAIDIEALFIDSTQVTVTFSAGKERVTWTTTADDRNRVRSPLREESLDNMLMRYRELLFTPSRWDAMTAPDWDRVPQPIRTIAYRQMAAYWAGFYDVGGRYDL
jgi:hypothetical protein